jgi:hypothetical protein
MAHQIVRFASLLFCSLALAPTLAHLLELPNKMQLPRDEYLIVQQIYRGWALLAIVVGGALVSTFALLVISRHGRAAFAWALVAFLAIVGTQLVFWVFTYPTNQQTDNWTILPAANWQELRSQWEYSHAASAGLNLAALIAVILSVLARVKVDG